MKRILVLGGTNFLGRRFVEQLAKTESYSLTIFNRGITNPDLFMQLEHIIGDRENELDLNKILIQHWDFIIDFSGFFPKSVRKLIQGINKDLTKYIYISSCSAYDNDKYVGMFRNEKAPLLDCSIHDESDSSMESYGKRKAECERIISNSNISSVIFRPALVFGPNDSTDRFYYWLYQVHSNDKVLVPEGGKRQFSMTYVDDLVHCILNAVQHLEIQGIFNCISYPATSIEQIIELNTKLLDRKPEFISVDAAILQKNYIQEWTDIPLWLNSDDFTYSNEAIMDRLNFIPTEFEESVKKTLSFYKNLKFHKPKIGINDIKQTELIKQVI